MSKVRKSQSVRKPARVIGAKRSERTPRSKPATPKQLDRQSQSFYMHLVENKKTREIATELGVDQKTVIRDIHTEQKRISDELKQSGALDRERAKMIALLRHIIAASLERAKHAFGERCYDTAVKAVETMSRLLGLEAAIKIDLGMQPLLDALEK